MVKLIYDCCGKEYKPRDEWDYIWLINQDYIQLKSFTKICPECDKKEAIKFYGLKDLVGKYDVCCTFKDSTI